MSLYITDLTEDEPLPDYSVLKEAFMAAEAKAASNRTTKTSEGLKVDIFKENIGIFHLVDIFLLRSSINQQSNL